VPLAAAAARVGAGDDPPDLRLVLPALATWLVAWQGHRLPVAVLLGGATVLALAAVLVLLRHRAGAGVVVAAVCGCTAASCVVTGLVAEARASGPLAELARAQASVRVEAVLTADPRVAVPRGPGAGRDLVVVRLRVEQLQAHGRAYRLRAPVVLLSSDPTWLDLLPSQRIQAEGRLRAAEPGDDVAAVLSGRGSVLVRSPPSGVQRVAGRLRAGLRDAAAPLPEAERGLLPGLVVGDVSRLEPEIREDFRTVGLTHLTAVSGTNCSIVIGAVLLLTTRLRMGRRAGPVLAGLALAGFVVLARPDPSVLRASVMGTIGLLGLATGTRRTALPALCAAVLVLLLVDPDLAGTAGFALSVLATAGLLVLAPPWTAALGRLMPRWLAAAVAVPAAAQVACGPVVVALSSHLGLLTVPANLLAVPAVAPATVLGVLAAVVAPLWLPAAQALTWLGWLPTAWLVLVARVGAGLPGATVPWPEGSTGALLLAGLTAAVLPALTRRRLRLGLLAATTGVVVAAAGTTAVRPAWPPPNWAVVACDVGQGDALVLRAGPSSAVVVDAGPYAPAVDACLRRLGIRSVPVVLLTHLHADHAAGLPGVLRGRRVGAVQVGPLDEPVEQGELVRAWAARAGVPLVRPGLGEVRTAGPVRWTVLAPARTYRGTRSDPNNASLVLRVEVGGVRVLLTGDVEPEAQADLVERGADVRADVLKTPHHGSAHQDLAFLDAVGARVVLTSVGEGNTYGHPSALTLGHLTRHGALSLRTDLHGDLAIVLLDGALAVVTGSGEVPSGLARGP
jgi:competence protein ComEC